MGDVSKDKQAIDNYIKKIADYIGTDADSLKKGLGYDVADNISQQYNNIIEEAKKKESDFDIIILLRYIISYIITKRCV